MHCATLFNYLMTYYFFHTVLASFCAHAGWCSFNE